MLTTTLLEKLLDIERAVGLTDRMTVRKMLMDLETQVLRLQQELLAALDEVRRLREEQESGARGGAACFLGPPAGAAQVVRKAS